MLVWKPDIIRKKTRFSRHIPVGKEWLYTLESTVSSQQDMDVRNTNKATPIKNETRQLPRMVTFTNRTSEHDISMEVEVVNDYTSNGILCHKGKSDKIQNVKHKIRPYLLQCIFSGAVTKILNDCYQYQ